jgi:hypothetical protein
MPFLWLAMRLAKPDPTSKRGRKAFVPTVKQRDRVMLLTAGGLTEPAIAAVLGCCERTLRKCFKAELATGRGVKRAQNLERLEAAARKGNVSAMRGESQELRAGETAAVRRERAEAAVRERTSKRQLLEQDARTAGRNSDWGELLDWPQH